MDMMMYTDILWKMITASLQEQVQEYQLVPLVWEKLKKKGIDQRVFET